MYLFLNLLENVSQLFLSIYRVLIKKINCETWVNAGFGNVLVDALLRNEEDVVRANACNHWLPATVF